MAALSSAFSGRLRFVLAIGLLLGFASTAHAVTANFVECSITPQGALSCTSIAGGSCKDADATTGYPGSKFCKGQSGLGQAKCNKTALGVAVCTPWDATSGPLYASCYSEDSVAKCYSSIPFAGTSNASIVASVSLLGWSQNINQTSFARSVTFQTNTYAGPFTISGFQITGEFQITTQTGTCTGSSPPGSSCTVSVTTTPRLPGSRYGTLSMVTSVGTLTVPLITTGLGLPLPVVADNNAGLFHTLRGVAPTPRYLQRVGSLSSRQPAVHSSTSGRRQKLDEVDFDGGSSPDLCAPNLNLNPNPNPDPRLEPKPDPKTDDPAPPDPESNPEIINPDPGLDDFGEPGGGGGGGITGGTSDVVIAMDPVNVAIGNKVHIQTDFDNGGFPGPLLYQRTYNSFAFTSASLIRQDVGVGWRSNWDRRVVQDAGGGTATVVREDGKSYVYQAAASNWVWTGSAEVVAKLAQTLDANSSPVGWKLTLPNGNIEQYDAIGRLTSVTPLAGFTYTLVYDTSGRLQYIQNGFGRRLTLSYDGNGRVATMTDPSGGITTSTYDTLGRLTSVTYPDQRRTQYQYENATWPFALTAVIDGLGTRYVTFAYDAQGRVSGSQFAGGVGSGSVTYLGSTGSWFTDALGTVWKKSFATNQSEVQLTAETVECSGCPTSSSQLNYDFLGTLTSHINKEGIARDYTYNSRGLPTIVVEAANHPESRVTNIAWHATLPLKTQVTTASNVVSYQYDAQGRKTSETTTVGGATRTTSYAYNAQGLLSQVDGPRTDVGDITTYTYDALGNKLTVTNPLGQITRYSLYNGLGQPGRIDYPNGTSRLFTYDARGRVLTDTSVGITTTKTYDANGKLITNAKNDGSSVTFLYDTAQRLTGINNSHGEQIRYTLDAAGNVTRTDRFDGVGNLVSTASVAFDGLGRKIRDVDAAGKVTTYHYDSNGNMNSVSDPMLNTITTGFDILNRPILVRDPFGHSIQVTYDTADRITSLTDANGNSTRYTYNGFGNRTAVTSPDSGASTYTFDGASNMLTKTDARGKTTTYTYDASGRLTRVVFADGQGVVKTYDIAANGVGQLASMVDLAGTTSFAYDTNGRVVTKTQTSQGITLVMSYARDSLGRATSITYPSGKVLGVSYTNERVGTLTWNGATVISGVQYFPFGSPESWLFGGTKEYTRYIDQNNRIWKYLTPSGSRTLTYDAAGHVTRLQDSGGSSQIFSYDAIGRVTSFQGFTSSSTSEARTYTYDNNGNRLAATVNGTAYAYTYAANSNRLLSVSGLYTNTYDVAGNLLSDGRLTHTYDARGRLLQTVVPGSPAQTLTFQYNGNDQRVTKFNSSTASGRMWFYDEAGHIVGEYAYPGGAAVHELIWLDSTPVAVAANLPISCPTPPCTAYGVGYIWSDQIDTPRAITNPTGATVWQWDSAPFGDTLANLNPGGLGGFTFNLRFPGQFLDPPTGLHHNWHRDYDPALGRYIESDPVGLSGGANTYAYVSGGPISRIDPLGLAGSDASCNQISIEIIPPDVCKAACIATGGAWLAACVTLRSAQCAANAGRWMASCVAACR